MDDRRFDSLTKALARGQSRRSLLKGLLGLGGAAAVGGTLLEGPAEAARRPTPTPKPITCPGNQIPVGGVCTCPGGLSQCNPGTGPACCNSGVDPTSPGYSECCDNACCNGTCYGEELCCRTTSRTGGLPPTHKFCDNVCIDLTVAGNCCDDGDCGNPCQVCNHDRHICVDRCDAQTQVCCTEQAGPGVCVTGECCLGVPGCGAGRICCQGEGRTICVAGDCCADQRLPAYRCLHDQYLPRSSLHAGARRLRRRQCLHDRHLRSRCWLHPPRSQLRRSQRLHRRFLRPRHRLRQSGGRLQRR